MPRGRSFLFTRVELFIYLDVNSSLIHELHLTRVLQIHNVFSIFSPKNENQSAFEYVIEFTRIVCRAMLLTKILIREDLRSSLT